MYVWYMNRSVRLYRYSASLQDFCFLDKHNLCGVRPHYANKQTSPTVEHSCCCVVSIAQLLLLQWLNFCILKASHKIVPQTARCIKKSVVLFVCGARPVRRGWCGPAQISISLPAYNCKKNIFILTQRLNDQSGCGVNMRGKEWL